MRQSCAENVQRDTWKFRLRRTMTGKVQMVNSVADLRTARQRGHSVCCDGELIFLGSLLVYFMVFCNECFGHLSPQVELPKKLKDHQALSLSTPGLRQRPAHHLRETNITQKRCDGSGIESLKRSKTRERPRRCLREKPFDISWPR